MATTCPDAGDDDDVPLTALEAVHGVHVHLPEDGDKDGDQEDGDADEERVGDLWEPGALQGQGELLFLLAVEGDHPNGPRVPGRQQRAEGLHQAHHHPHLGQGYCCRKE